MELILGFVYAWNCTGRFMWVETKRPCNTYPVMFPSWFCTSLPIYASDCNTRQNNSVYPLNCVLRVLMFIFTITHHMSVYMMRVVFVSWCAHCDSGAACHSFIAFWIWILSYQNKHHCTLLIPGTQILVEYVNKLFALECMMVCNHYNTCVVLLHALQSKMLSVTLPFYVQLWQQISPKIENLSLLRQAEV